MNISILILAAGSSSRMGKAKQLLAWKNATLLEHVLNTARASLADDIVLVTGAAANEIKARIPFDDDLTCLMNDHWNTGMGSSISCGIRYIAAQKEISDGVLIMLADQPLIDTAYLNQLMTIYAKGEYGIIGTKYESGPGVPALFHKHYFKDLAALNKEYGARDVLENNLADLYTIDPMGKEKDIDTSEDYLSLIRRYSEEE